MQFVNRLKDSLKYRGAKFLMPEWDPNRVLSNTYFVQHPTCQVKDLWFLQCKYLGRIPDGRFVDVGAHDGQLFSNTWGLARAGWAGLLIEPLPELAEQCRSNHRHHNGIEVLTAAIGTGRENSIRLYKAGPLTTSSRELFKEYSGLDWALNSLTGESIDVPCFSLDQALKDRGFSPGFEFLSVDVEGNEPVVFEGFDLELWRPKMMVVEIVDNHPDLQSTVGNDALLNERLLNSGYRIVYKDRINTVFVETELWIRSNS